MVLYLSALCLQRISTDNGVVRTALLGFLSVFFIVFPAQGQTVVPLIDSLDQQIFTHQRIEYLEDNTNSLTIADVSSKAYDDRFTPGTTFSPTNPVRTSTYWYRIKVKHNSNSIKDWNLEFFDQTIDRIDFYFPQENGEYLMETVGDQLKFDERPQWHKNFILNLPNKSDKIQTYYFKLKSEQRADVIVVLRSQSWLFKYALDEYLFFGIFYGMILVFSFYNLLMFIAVREAHYLFYVLYLVCVALYEMSADGIAYQYLWPNSPHWNSYAPGIALYLASCLSLLFTISLLSVWVNKRSLFHLAMGSIAFRTVFLAISLTLYKDWFAFKGIEIVPLGTALFIGLSCLKQGFRYARFIVVGYFFLFFGIVTKILLYFDINWMPFGELSHYSLGFCMIIEMLFLSFAMSDKIKLLLLEKHEAQLGTIEQLKINQQLKDNLNVELEKQVQLKTGQLEMKNKFIETQNQKLAEANQQLMDQAETISAMNAILEQDNDLLKHRVDEVKQARVLSKEVDFEEFSSMYPDDESCLQFMAGIKWRNGFACRKCHHTNYNEGKSFLSRRCSRCGYEESVVAHTLLKGTRLPINKAFYMIFLVYSSNGQISSHKLSEILHIRQSTCWAYSSRIKKAIHDHLKNKKHGHHEGWDSILFEFDEVNA
jgi:hypothetical protein